MRTYSSESVAKRGLERLMKRHPFIVGGTAVIDDHHYRLSIVIDALASEVPGELFEEFDVTIKQKETEAVQAEPEVIQANIEPVQEAEAEEAEAEAPIAEVIRDVQTLKTEVKTLELGFKTLESEVKSLEAEIPPRKLHERRNGIASPSPGTVCGKIWDLFDKQANKILSSNVSIEQNLKHISKNKGLELPTLRTQFWKWRKFNNVPTKHTKD